MAKRLEDKPFHLVAAHNQRDTRDNVVDYVRSKGLSTGTPNFTVTSFGRHPKVEGNGYVPYYMVFDHHGDLVHHHMCGDYHGGDGLRCVEIVDDLLADVPAIYLGPEPFVEVADLAEQVGALKRLPAALREIRDRLADDPGPSAGERAELERLLAAVDDYRERMIERADDMVATAPADVLPHLRELEKQFGRDPSATEIERKIDELEDSDELDAAIKIHKKFRRTMRALERMDRTPRNKERAARRLEKLIEDAGDLPIADRVRTTIEELRQK